MNDKKSKTIRNIFVIIGLLIIFLSIYIYKEFRGVSSEQLIHTLFVSKGTSLDSVESGALFIIPCILIVLLILKLINVLLKKYNIKLSNCKLNIITIIFFIFSIIFFIYLLDFDFYIKNQLKKSNFIEENYVNPKEVEIIFPESKRNLIYIFVESLEMTNVSVENGGALKTSYIPELEELALENINFSNTNKLGGAYQLTGSAWTTNAMISHTSGVPLKLPIFNNNYFNDLSVPGAYGIGDILKENGYENYLMIGSRAIFGGREEYFKYHGDYKIYDYEYAKENNWIDEDYFVWWGYEDRKLYEFAKEELEKISKNDEPFNFTLLTVDTHFFDGYLDNECETKFDKKYANTFSCASSMLDEFINWIKKQDFYENTTIVITGDHFTIQDDLYERKVYENYDRTIYNAFINLDVKPKNTKERLFTTLDMLPTTLASLGVEIEGNRLGLGTNLFSDEKTLPEEYGFKYFDKELLKNSDFYNNNILKSKNTE